MDTKPVAKPNDVGKRITYKGLGGTIRFVGMIDVPSAKITGEWIGIELDTPQGRNDGSVHGKRLFTCTPLHGVFVRSDTKLVRLTAKSEGSSINRPLNREEKAALVIARLAAREKIRTEAATRRREDKAKQLDPVESTSSFWEGFNTSEQEITRNLAAFVTKYRGFGRRQRTACRSRCDALTENIKALSNVLAEATIFLPKHDCRMAQQQVDKLFDMLRAAREEVFPRSKFSFGKGINRMAKGAAAEVASAAPASADPSPKVTADVARPKYNSKLERVVSSLSGRTLVVKFDSSDVPNKAQDVLLSSLNNCVVCIPEVVSGMRLAQLKACHIFVGAVAGSVFIESCADCVISVATRQIRIHHTFGCDFYVHSQSGPIIEDCGRLRFGPLVTPFENSTALRVTAKLSVARNLWNDVKDFKWLRQQQSPHWCLMPKAAYLTGEAMRAKFEDVPVKQKDVPTMPPKPPAGPTPADVAALKTPPTNQLQTPTQTANEDSSSEEF